MMPQPWVWLVPLLAGLMTLLLTPALRRYLIAREILDHPDCRRSHSQPTPRGGGLGIAAGLIFGLLLVAGQHAFALVSLGFVIVLCTLGWLDDRFDLAARWRFLAQVLIASGMLAWQGGVEAIEVAGHLIHQPWLWTALALPALVWLINLHNFMDGSDGLAAMQGTWSGLLLGLLFLSAGQGVQALVALTLAASCLGFFCWNRPPAFLFMGDAGSVLIGGMVAWLVLAGITSESISVWLSFMICAVFVVDATATLLSRVAKGQQWYTPHRLHAYQRLISMAWTHGQVLAFYGLLNAVVVFPAVVAGWIFPEQQLWLAIVVAGVLGLVWWRIQSLTEPVTNGESIKHD
jgi:Fuc2NAc and GlcNAc transferase